MNIKSISPTDWLQKFEEMGAVWRHQSLNHPHVKTSMSGQHVDTYFNSDFVISHPGIVDAIIESDLIPAIEKENRKPTWVVGYAPYSIFIAYACAQKLKVRCGYSKPADDYSITFNITSDDEVLVVADDLYTGGAVTQTVKALEGRGAKIVPYTFALMNLSGSDQLDGRRIIAAASLPAHRWSPDDCNLCQGGSEALLSRPNWQRLQSGITK